MTNDSEDGNGLNCRQTWTREADVLKKSREWVVTGNSSTNPQILMSIPWSRYTYDNRNFRNRNRLSLWYPYYLRKWGGGEGGAYSGPGGRLFGGGRLLERGRLFEEMRYTQYLQYCFSIQALHYDINIFCYLFPGGFVAVCARHKRQAASRANETWNTKFIRYRYMGGCIPPSVFLSRIKVHAN